MKTNMFAYTAPGADYPEYISVNRRQGDGMIEITVRSPKKADGSCGDTASIVLHRGQLGGLFYALRDELTPPMMKAMGQSI
jgi:hypothetical protein